MRKILTLFLAICFLAGASISVWGGGLNNTDPRSIPALSASQSNESNVDI